MLFASLIRLNSVVMASLAYHMLDNVIIMASSAHHIAFFGGKAVMSCAAVPIVCSYYSADQLINYNNV